MSWRLWLGFTPTAADLAHAMLRELRRMGHPDWVYSADRNELRNSRDSVVHLGNLALEFRQAPRRHRRALLLKYCTVADAQSREIPKLWRLAERSLYPVVRSRYDTSLLALRARVRDQTPPRYSSRPLAGSLCVRLVYDFGAGVAHVTDEQLDTWGQSFDTAFPSAIANLRALQAPSWHEVERGVFRLLSAVSYEESFVLLDKVRAAFPSANDTVFIPCNRGVLLGASACDEDALLRMIARAEQALQECPWPLSADLIRHDGDGWQSFDAAGTVAMRAREVATVERARLYHDQKAVLDELHEADEADVFVANCGLVRRETDGMLCSWSTWADGVDTSLPQSDLVVLARGIDTRPRPEFLQVRWEDLQRICADRLTAEPLDPPRHRTDGFPAEEEWTRLAEIGRKAPGHGNQDAR